MDLSQLQIEYACFYCKKDCYSSKDNLKKHWQEKCKRLKSCYNSRLMVKSGANLNYVTAFLNPANVDIDLQELVLKKIVWPDLVFHFTTHSRWKRAKQETGLYESSAENSD